MQFRFFHLTNAVTNEIIEGTKAADSMFKKASNPGILQILETVNYRLNIAQLLWSFIVVSIALLAMILSNSKLIVVILGHLEREFFLCDIETSIYFSSSSDFYHNGLLCSVDEYQQGSRECTCPPVANHRVGNNRRLMELR